MSIVPIPIEFPEWTTDLLKKLAGSAAEELGLTFRDSLRMFRAKRAVRFLEQFKKTCTNAGIDPRAIKVSLLFDIFEGATLEENDDLQDMWANLLTNAADSRERVLVRSAFPQILRQISKEEAVYLSEMFEVSRRTEMFILKAYVPPPFDAFDAGPTAPPKLDAVSYDNLRRLGLIDVNTETIPAATSTASLDELRAGAKTYRVLTEETYTLTSLGSALVQACQAPKSETETSDLKTMAATS